MHFFVALRKILKALNFPTQCQPCQVVKFEFQLKMKNLFRRQRSVHIGVFRRQRSVYIGAA